MLDVEKVKKILFAEVNKREKAKTKWLNYSLSGNKHRSEFYEKRYRMYRSRFEGMCDMLYDLGYLAWSNDENDVFVEKRDYGDITTPYEDEEIPF